MSYRVLTRDEHFEATEQKRILALDGGGLRGLITLGFLQRIETTLKASHADNADFRLCHYFDLIAGTSTGAIIAAALAAGMTVQEVTSHYRKLGKEVFTKDWFRNGLVQSRYSEDKLIEHLQKVFGKELKLGSPSIKTGLLIVTKRLDTGSPWPLGNNPKGRYFRAKADDTWISNADYPLWKVIRASTAAPSYFDPEPIVIAAQQGKKDVVGTFVDGGVSPFNNPSLQALLYATLNGYKVTWKTGADSLLLVSVGTGASNPSQIPSQIAALGAVRALTSLMDDCSALVETFMQWVSSSRTAREIDREIGDLKNDLIAGTPLITYLRYNVALSQTEVSRLCPGLSMERIESLVEMDNSDNMDALYTIGETAASEQVKEADFPTIFDLRE